MFALLRCLCVVNNKQHLDVHSLPGFFVLFSPFHLYFQFHFHSFFLLYGNVYHIFCLRCCICVNYNSMAYFRRVCSSKNHDFDFISASATIKTARFVFEPVSLQHFALILLCPFCHSHMNRNILDYISVRSILLIFLCVLVIGYHQKLNDTAART